MTTYYVKRGDSLPPAEAQLLKEDKTPLNLTDASVRFLVRTAPRGGVLLIGRPAVVSDIEGGKVLYAWQDGDTESPGTYVVEWEVTFLDGKKVTVPTDSYDRLIVLQDLG